MHIMFCHLGREHLGIEYLSAVLKQNGFKVSLAYDPGYFSIQDNTIYSPFLEKIFKREKEMLSKICKEKPDIVAFPIYTSTYKWAKRMAELIKENIKTKVIFGGSHATLVPDLAIENKAVDFVVVGEGESHFLELVRSLEKRKRGCTADNVYYKDNGRIIKNKISAALVNLDLLPYPDKELFEGYICYREDYLALASRGCPFSCTYCCESHLNNMYSNKYFRQRSVGSVIGELEYMKSKYNFKEIIFFDNIFHFNKQWLKDFLKEYRVNIKVPFKCMGYVSFFDEETAFLLKKNYCYAINFGIQSMDDNIRKRLLKRNENDSQIEKALRACDKADLSFDADLIFDLPGENEKDIVKKTVFFKQFKRLNRIKCFNLSYFPNLDIVQMAKDENSISELDIVNIENGKGGDLSRISTFKSKQAMKANRSLINFYKMLPFLPSGLVRYLSRAKRYKKLCYIPEGAVVFLQVLIAFKNRDYRFYVYAKDYLRRFKHFISKKIFRL